MTSRCLRVLTSATGVIAQNRARAFSTASATRQSDTRPPFNTAPAFHVTQHPDEEWKLGDGMRTTTELGARWKKDEKAGWKTMNFAEMEKPLIYKMLTSAIVPRPIAFVSTISETGVPNLAPFSYFSLVAHNPPLVSVSFTLPANRPKDTRENIKATKEFTVNIISEPFVEAANSASVEAPADVDEWIVSGLTQEPSDVVKPPRVRESAVSFECELFHFLDISPSSTGPSLPDATNSLVLGRIRRAHVRNAVLASDSLQVDTAALRAVSRLGGTAYARIGEGFEIPRPSWRKEEGTIRELMKKGGRQVDD
ncbi:uncharacterized protein FOMMEDRAFT_146973 [Fomitiporia mediterranea MF3/22]|uniref:uncharacterized protein n=1 Tax=Fomitiporia mediterranea (strain MF3/22) TaxID=694068 RepID=UPI0004408002|nr:uncharacterized protein FOMMEDRAFT_146973 [Fomitiporia mediterranea MF3/22]EJD03429.1 hypothetical protein FOMMEDRAFT_146973 [Fomitiporia mediterranea MF3/22]